MLGKHVRKYELHLDCHCEDCYERLDLDILESIITVKETKREIKTQMKKSTGNSGYSKKWYQDLTKEGRRENSRAIANLILSFTPNLLELTIDIPREEVCQPIWSFLELLAVSTEGPKLNQLSVQVLSDWDEGLDLGKYESLFSLPIKSVSMDECFNEGKWWLQGAAFTITTLSITGSDVVGDSLIRFLRCFEKLQHLTCSPPPHHMHKTSMFRSYMG